jgi:4-alpha-glucanotransferase
VNSSRSAGVQLHPTSLPGGRLGAAAHAWVDWLADAGQSWWQMLPLGPPDRYGSPYKARSAFAASPALLAEPTAPVSKDEELDFREREAAWIEGWRKAAGRDAVA